MNTISSFQKEDPGDDRPSEWIQESIYPYLHEINVTDGGEFLDDGLRMADLLFGGSEVKADQSSHTATS